MNNLLHQSSIPYHLSIVREVLSPLHSTSQLLSWIDAEFRDV